MNRSVKVSFLRDNFFWFEDVGFDSSFEIDSDRLFIPYFYYTKKQIISSILNFALRNYRKSQIVIFDFQNIEIMLNFEKLLNFFKQRISNSDDNFIVIICPEFFDKYDANLKIYRFTPQGKIKILDIPNFNLFYHSKIKFSLKDFVYSLSMLYEIREKFSFVNTILYIIENFGKPFSFRQSASDLNIRFETLKNFIDYLENAFFIKVLEEEESPKAQRTIIINDWRLYNYLMNFSKKELLLEEIHKGAILSYQYLKSVLEGKTLKIDEHLNPIVV
ncbi:MAG: hypothetical protein N2504_01000 [candidate division WOR-3 bacterium]|nr:hypothetical protein [candidate division WOR-3 bacterium]MCX7947152.1 hypothetical protein [candidate division WOR-3 bacterium]MDW8150208.1 hypothetical protein [candidate division WOR-3 bacterium]